MQNIIAVLFKNESEGFQAITELRQAPVTDKYAALQVALVKRQGQEFTLCDSFDSGIQPGGGVVLGGLMGSLLGILGGPIGVLLMGAYGALAGSLAGNLASADGGALLETAAQKLMDGEVALIALVEEQEEAELDAKFAKFNAEVARFDAAVIAAELDEAERMQAEMQRMTLIELRKVKKDEHKKKVEEKRAQLDEDFANFKQQFAQ